jgi:hypothetical protein
MTISSRCNNYFSLFLKQCLIIAVIFIGFATHLKAQDHMPFDEQTGKFSYSKVIFIDSTSKDVLFTRAETWFHNHFETEDTALKIVDRVQGKISGNGVTVINIKNGNIDTDVPMLYTLNVIVKGNRCRYEFTDISYRAADKKLLTAEKQFKSTKLDNKEKQYLSKTKKAIATIEKSLIAAMTNNAEEPVVKKYQLK